MKKAILTFLLIISLLFLFSCKSIPEDTGEFECEFDTKAKTATITGYNGESEEITVPDSFGKYKVTKIGKGAFSKKYDISSITLPNTLEQIEASAFEYCISIENIDLPTSLKSIKNTAFLNCRGLKEIYIPESITHIGVCVFSGCTSLERIEVSENNPNYSSDSNGALLDKKQTVIYQYPMGSQRLSYEMPETVSEVESYAFENSICLENVTFSPVLKKLGSCAFQKSGIIEALFPNSLQEIAFSCFNESKLTNIDFGNGINIIGEAAFSWCTSLNNVNIPSSVKTIGRSAFYMCTSIKGFEVDKENQNYSSDVYGVLFDKNMTVLHFYPTARIDESYFIPDTVITVEANAFTPTLNLKSVTIPDSVENIGEKAFSNCVNLEDVIYEGSPPSSIADNAFDK